MEISPKRRLTFVVLTTLLSNLIPLVGWWFVGWSVFSVLILFWIEGIFIILKGKAHFFLVAQIGRGSNLKNNIIKSVLSLISLFFIVWILLIQAWMILLSIRQVYAPQYMMPFILDFWGNTRLFFYLFFVVIPLHFQKEPTLMVGILLTLLNYVVMFFYLSIGAFRISITNRYWRSVISIFVLAILNWWMLGDIKNTIAPELTFRVTVGFILLKLIVEMFPYIWRKTKK